MSAACPLVEVSGLTYRYGDGTFALRGIDFVLRRGETVVLLGPNGAGKTTFLLHLNGLLEGEGRVAICGLEVRKPNLKEIRRRVGLVFQDPEEQLFMPSVLEDAAFGPLNLGMGTEEALARAREALRQTGIADKEAKAPYHLSAGEKRRAALAGVLAMNPEILLLDEPTTSLDPPGQRDLVELLRSLPQSKIISTHDAAFARAIGDRAVFFQQGKIVAETSVEEVIRRFDWEAHATPDPTASGKG